jgi:leucine dehydrogenase
MLAMEIKELDKEELRGFIDYDGHEKVCHIVDEVTGLNAYIAVHNTNLGPSLGGCRMYNYKSDEDAIRDVLRLSRGMTYKNALADLHLGGGKSVIVGDPFTDKTDELVKAMGKAVDALGGIYISAQDSGMTNKDIAMMAEGTPYIVGIPVEGSEDNGKTIGGDPSPYTAYGIYCGMKVAVRHKMGRDLSGVKVAVQGVGAVGHSLCELLHKDGASLAVTDVRQENLDLIKDEITDVEIVSLEDIFSVDADVFAPCALGAQINDDTIPLLKAKIVCGAANNQLARSEHGDELAKRDILYIPDYLLNAGGVIAVSYEYFVRAGEAPFSHDLTYDNMVAHIEKIGKTLDKILNIAEAKSWTPARAADHLAEALFTNDGQAPEALIS